MKKLLTVPYHLQGESDSSVDSSQSLPKRPHSPGHHGTPPKRYRDEDELTGSPMQVDGHDSHVAKQAEKQVCWTFTPRLVSFAQNKIFVSDMKRCGACHFLLEFVSPDLSLSGKLES